LSKKKKKEMEKDKMEKHTLRRPCSSCGKRGVKLWREYSVCNAECLMRLTPTCYACTIAQHPEESIERYLSGKSDQLCGKVPYITTINGEDVYGYFASPPDQYALWKGLP
jgi:hypothetical protein